MQDDFEKYLQAIGTSNTLRERASYVYDVIAKLCPEKIAHIFLSDLITQDGTRTYENLWFFSPNFAMEAKDFLSKDDYDIASIGVVSYLRVQMVDYDFKQATDKSRANLNFSFGFSPTAISGTMKATRENCDFLREVTIKIILPRIRHQ